VDPLHQLQPAGIREAEIAKHQVEFLLPELFHRLLAVKDSGGFQAIIIQQLA
jgi:hypothetical protein